MVGNGTNNKAAANVAGANVKGNNNNSSGGDIFKDIQNSTVINRSLVQYNVGAKPEDQISCSVIEVNKNNPIETLQKVALSINVELNEDEEEIPFIPFKKFYNCLNENKLFFYGKSGSGKSRTIFEILKEKITTFNYIYIINERNPIGVNLDKVNISQLVSRVKDDDVIIWYLELYRNVLPKLSELTVLEIFYDQQQLRKC